jgi:hypothetical protein
MTQSPQTGQGMRGRAQLSWEPGLEDEEEAMDLEGCMDLGGTLDGDRRIRLY